MGKDKLKRFAEIETFDNVIQPTAKEALNTSHFLKGKWASDFFNNSNPIILELGCGKGEYSVNLAKLYPDINFIGIDIKGSRMWLGAKEAINEGIKNVGFLRTRIEWIESFFAEDEISEIWITFPDPQLHRKREKKRLTSPLFLNSYRKMLKEEGIIHLKTDNRELHNYTLEILKYNKAQIIESTNDLYNSDLQSPILSIKTFYEKKFLIDNIKITYIKFRINKELISLAK